jgi:hypothetical protein
VSDGRLAKEIEQLEALRVSCLNQRAMGPFLIQCEGLTDAALHALTFGLGEPPLRAVLREIYTMNEVYAYQQAFFARLSYGVLKDIKCELVNLNGKVDEYLDDLAEEEAETV